MSPLACHFVVPCYLSYNALAAFHRPIHPSYTGLLGVPRKIGIYQTTRKANCERPAGPQTPSSTTWNSKAKPQNPQQTNMLEKEFTALEFLSLMFVAYNGAMVHVGFLRLLRVVSGEETPASHGQGPRALVIADVIKHVDAPKGDRCNLCHDDEPLAPVRLSCEHLFCCGCVHAVFARRDNCPICLRKPSPLHDTLTRHAPPSARTTLDGLLETARFKMKTYICGCSTLLACLPKIHTYCA